MMRLAALALVAVPVWAQNISVGIRAGIPATDAFKTGPGRFSFRNVPHRWTFGPGLEVRLPLSLAVTLDALYSRLEFEQGTTRQTGGQWEFPAMLRYRFGAGNARPFVAAGGSFNKITGLRTPTSSVTGVVFGAGVDLKAPLIRIAPELRYTRRLSESLTLEGLRSNQNQVVFLVGFLF